MPAAQRVTDSVVYHGEGPVWWAATQEMRFVDMLAGDVMALAADGTIRRYPTGSTVAAVVRPRRGGGAIVGRKDDIALADNEDLSDIHAISHELLPSSIRFNEGNCDPDGRFWLGSMSGSKNPGKGQMFMLAPQSEPELVMEGLTTSNGLGFSPDGTLAYYNDTPTLKTMLFDYSATTGLTNPRPFVSYGDDEGRPDGLCVDAEGGVWIAMNRKGHVRRYSPDGQLDQKITVVPTLCTAMNFGGPELETLYITTSRENIPDDAEPEAGSLYAIEPGVKGLSPLAFAG